MLIFKGSNLWGDSIGVGNRGQVSRAGDFHPKTCSRYMQKRRSYIHSSIFCLGSCDDEGLSLESAFFFEKIVLRNGHSIQELDVFSRVKEIVRFDDQ